MSTSSPSASPRAWARRWTHRATASLLRPGRVLPVMIPILIRLATVTADLQSQKAKAASGDPVRSPNRVAVGQASLGARTSLLLCRANEVGLAELVDVDNAVFGALAFVVVILPGRLHDERAFLGVAPQNAHLHGRAGSLSLPLELAGRHGDLLLAVCGFHLSHLLENGLTTFR